MMSQQARVNKQLNAFYEKAFYFEYCVTPGELERLKLEDIFCARKYFVESIRGFF